MSIHVVKVANEAEMECCRVVRREVFIHEQQIDEKEEWDGLDEECAHFLALTSAEDLQTAVGTARLWMSPAGQAKAQRVAVLAKARKTGVGAALMIALENEVADRGVAEIILGAQVSAIPFYEKLGYSAYGEEFDDAGIPHRMMHKRLTGAVV
jgi:predicted GNAT family N-acyltransferase